MGTTCTTCCSNELEKGEFNMNVSDSKNNTLYRRTKAKLQLNLLTINKRSRKKLKAQIMINSYWTTCTTLSKSRPGTKAIERGK